MICCFFVTKSVAVFVSCASSKDFVAKRGGFEYDVLGRCIADLIEECMKNKRSGPKPELFSLYPLKFDEAVDILVKAKPKKNDDKDVLKLKREKKAKNG